LDEVKIIYIIRVLLALSYWPIILARRITPPRPDRWLGNMRRLATLFGEPARCIHVGDRESDIYELFCTAQELGTVGSSRS